MRRLRALVASAALTTAGVAGPWAAVAHADTPSEPGATPDALGNFAVCDGYTSGNAYFFAYCNYGQFQAGVLPTSIEYVNGNGEEVVDVNAAGGEFSIYAAPPNPSDGTMKVCYSDSICNKAGILTTQLGATGYPQEAFWSGINNEPDSANPDPIFGALSRTRNSEVDYVEDGVGLVIAVVLAGLGAGLLVKYARRSVRSA